MIIFLTLFCLFLFLAVVSLYRELSALKSDMNFLNFQFKRSNQELHQSFSVMEKDLHEFYDNTLMVAKQHTMFQEEIQKFVVLVLSFMNTYNEENTEVEKDPFALNPAKKSTSKPD
jgi:predicted PurR-regulated permease PerM